jgi:hypothetical protein
LRQLTPIILCRIQFVKVRVIRVKAAGFLYTPFEPFGGHDFLSAASVVQNGGWFFLDSGRAGGIMQATGN